MSVAPSTPSSDDQNCLQVLSNVPKRAKQLLVESQWFRVMSLGMKKKRWMWNKLLSMLFAGQLSTKLLKVKEQVISIIIKGFFLKLIHTYVFMTCIFYVRLTWDSVLHSYSCFPSPHFIIYTYIPLNSFIVSSLNQEWFLLACSPPWLLSLLL